MGIRQYVTKNKPLAREGNFFNAPCRFDVPEPISWRDSEGRCMGCGQRFAERTGHSPVRAKLIKVDIQGGIFAEEFRVTVEDVK